MTKDKKFDLCNYFLWFMLYSFIGWIYESVYCSINNGELINRGFLHGPYIPIYGCCAVLVVFLFSKVKNVFKLFIYSMCVTSLLEYVTSWLLELAFHKTWWDYSDYPLNLNGRICVYAAVLFGALCTVVVKYVQPRVAKFTLKINRRVRVAVAFVLAAVIAIDCGISFAQEIREVGVMLSESIVAMVRSFW